MPSRLQRIRLQQTAELQKAREVEAVKYVDSNNGQALITIEECRKLCLGCNPSRKEKILALFIYINCLRNKVIATRYIKSSIKTFNTWIGSDKRFRNAITIGEEYIKCWIQEKLFNQAKSPYGTAERIFLAKSLHQDFKEKKVRDAGGNIYNTQVVFGDMSKEERLTWFNKLRGRKEVKSLPLNIGQPVTKGRIQTKIKEEAPF